MMGIATCGGKRMAKKRDRKGLETREDRGYQSGVLDPRALEQEGTSFADVPGHYPSEGDIEAWEDEETAPDIFAEASDEDRMQASGGHTQRQDEEPGARESPGLRRR
jgi:hypothetical protein